jgi:hypothetical protein
MMKQSLLTLILCASVVHAQVPTVVYRDHVVNLPGLVVNPLPPSYWDRLRVAPPQPQIIRAPVQQQLPTTQQTGPLPGQTADQQRLMQELVK